MSVEKSRRNVLKFGLAGVAGMIAGHSIVKNSAFAAGTSLQVSIPALSHREGVLSPASKTQALEALAPVLAGIVQASGMTLSSAQVAALKNKLVSRGAIQLPTTSAEGITVSSLSLGLKG